jgi:hypothetical protein
VLSVTDQWQITTNGGTFALTGPLGNALILPASTLPFYSVHAVDGQSTFILPKKNLALFGAAIIRDHHRLH